MDRPPRTSLLIDRGTAALAALAIVAALAASSGPPPWSAWLALPLIVVASRMPLILPAGSGDSLVIGLDSSLLVLLGLTLPWDSALVVWGTSITIAELTSKRKWDTRLFNAGVCVAAGAAALAVLQTIPRDRITSPQGLAVTVLAAVAYFGVDYLWSAVSIAAARSARLREAIELRGLPFALACFVGVDSLGFWPSS